MTVRRTETKTTWVLCALVATLAAMLCLGMGSTAMAGTILNRPEKGTYLGYPSPEADKRIIVGVTALDDDGNRYYCSEAGETVNYVVAGTALIADSEPARRIAWLMDRYDTEGDSLTLAAIGVLVHDYFDVDMDRWQTHRDVIYDEYPDIGARVDELWEEAGRNAPLGSAVEQTYAQGVREGEVSVRVVNAHDEALPGIAYTITLSGPAVFVENGEATISGVTAEEAIVHEWRATQAGEVTVTPTYHVPTLELISGSQDLIRLSEGMTKRGGDVVRFAARKDFAPGIVTETVDATVDPGEPIRDDVTILLDGEHNHWLDGEVLNATGWYFDGIPAERVGDVLAPESEESAESFLRRIADLGYEPSAYGMATFTESGQTVRVRATSEPGGDEPYLAPGDGRFGTWVWAIELAEQSERVREHLAHDVVTPFLDPAETNANRSRPIVESTVTEHSASVGAELSDTITVGGFPDDHGTFAGDGALGLDADRAHAQVSVWWAGDADDPSKDDDWRPDGERTPDEDEHHRLVGTWDYPAVNGRIRVGGGEPDAHGNAVNITAETHGWYVFVWSFAGDDRVAAASSAYDDAWERTRVRETPSTPSDTPQDTTERQTPPDGSEEPDKPTLVTQVDPERVMIGESFRDTATIRGTLPDGAYVTFSAYEAIADGELPGVNGKLLDEARVEPKPSGAANDAAGVADAKTGAADDDAGGVAGGTADGDDADGDTASDVDADVDADTAADTAVGSGDDADSDDGADAGDDVDSDDEADAGDDAVADDAAGSGDDADDGGTVPSGGVAPRVWTAVSPEISSPNAGLVYWRATVFSAEGDVLVTHELGVEGEVVTVTAEPDSETAQEEPEQPLPYTGADVGIVLAVACVALAGGIALLMAVHRPDRWFASRR
ncbi:peptidase [Bifidobacterium amazonense]|uniref:Peptidase n=1 Tax=Bifidobacterium amazonense TaxID=2809027 RepID=A0ABS9VVJ4_9BIFI|nr:peptidase [Bifidobacterium amazonense]MCH9276132.1 peptidase [Bifidobacterium amazonense]